MWQCAKLLEKYEYIIPGNKYETLVYQWIEKLNVPLDEFHNHFILSCFIEKCQYDEPLHITKSKALNQ